MKKIFKMSALIVGACFFTGAANAQLSSDKPALTAQQMTDLIQKGKAGTTVVAPAVSTSSDKPALTAQQMTDMMQKRIADAKITALPATAVSDKTTPVNLPSNMIVKSEPAKDQTATDPAGVKLTPSSQPTVEAKTQTQQSAVSNQGAVKPVTTEPATESKVPQPPMQSEKPVSSGQQ